MANLLHTRSYNHTIYILNITSLAVSQILRRKIDSKWLATLSLVIDSLAQYLIITELGDRYIETQLLNSQSQSQSQSDIAADGQSVCLSWCRAPTGAHDQIFFLIWKSLSCSFGAPSLTRCDSLW
jgi:hypothetical protein